MRLVYIAPFLHAAGGLERTLSDKSDYLLSKGHEVMYVTYKQGHEGFFYPQNDGIQHSELACSLAAIYRKPFILRLNEYMKLRSLFREKLHTILNAFKPDVLVVTIPNTEDFIYDIMAVAKSRGVPVVIESHLAAIYHMQGKPFTERLLCRLYPPIKAIRKADMLIALTEHDAENWRKQGVKKVAVIPNPVTAYSSKLSEVEKEKERIIAVGRLFEQKRFDRLIEAFALIAGKHPAWHIDIFGDGPLRPDLTALIESRGLQERISLNPVTKSIYSEYQRSQFFVLSSDYEGFGLVIIEAMACGIPVVSTDCPFGPSEIISDGETGLLAKMDVEDLARKMEWMITHEAERLQMGIKARQAAADYRKEVVMPKWEEAYMSAISSSSAKEQ
ncbi:MAG: glycosyltransferase family 4 protein [Prevotella sp.]|nr:glycosyltransferase family 4 protein [Prevotella sp.]